MSLDETDFMKLFLGFMFYSQRSMFYALVWHHSGYYFWVCLLKFWAIGLRTVQQSSGFLSITQIRLRTIWTYWSRWCLYQGSSTQSQLSCLMNQRRTSFAEPCPKKEWECELALQAIGNLKQKVHHNIFWCFQCNYSYPAIVNAKLQPIFSVENIDDD